MSDILERLRAYIPGENDDFVPLRIRQAADEIEAARVEIERLTAAKREALKIADERSKENVALRQQLASEQARAELFNARLSNEIDNCAIQEQRANALREQLVKAIAETTEKCAKIAEDHVGAANDYNYDEACRDITEVIRRRI